MGNRMKPRGFAYAAALATLTLVLYLPSLRNQFVNYDDPGYVVQNQHVLQGLSWKNVAWVFTSTTEANWHPLTWLSHMCDVELFRLNPIGHHLTNVLLHLCNVLLLFWLLRTSTNLTMSSAVVAALFAVHPLNVESVAWVSERKSLLCMFFMLLAFLAWGKYVRDGLLRWYSVVLLLFALALMAKPMAMIFPFLLLLADYWPLCRIGSEANNKTPAWVSRLFVEKIPLLLMSALSGLITLYAQHAGGALGSPVALPFNWRLGNAIYSYGIYLFKCFWASKLAVFYPHPENRLPLWMVLASAALLAIITTLALRYRTKRYLVVGWLWFVVALAPVIGIVQVGRQAWADRYAYIPSIGIFVMATWLAADLFSRAKISRSIIAATAIAPILCFSSISYRQIQYWHDSFTLFTHALAVTNNNAVAEDNLGEALVEMGRPDLAMQHFQAAARISPEVSTPHYNLGTLLQMRGELDQAIREYSLALRYSADPKELAQTHNNLGALLMQARKPADAKKQFDEALAIDPDKAKSLIGRGLLEYDEGSLDTALQDFTHALHIEGSPSGFFWAGRVLEDKGRFKEAAAEYERALKLAPDFRDARVHLQFVQSMSR